MDNNVFEALFPLIIQDLVSLIIDSQHLEFEIALEYLYDSTLYEQLAKEESKLWHLSSAKLLEMLIHEKQTNELLYPDYL